MSKLAKKLSTTTVKPSHPKQGPRSTCEGVYPPATDLEDWEQVQRHRLPPGNWASAQVIVDDALGITNSIDNDKFRYHWGRKCRCWPPELRQR